MNDEELIARLAADLVPVRKLAPPWVRLGRWALASFAILAMCVAAIGPRAGVSDALARPAFGASVMTLVLTAILAALAALVLAIPGAERSASQRALPVLVLAAWLTSLLVALEHGAGAPDVLTIVHGGCAAIIVGFAVAPAALLFGMLRRSAPLHPAWTAALGSIAAAALGTAATQLVCPIDDAAHHLNVHAAALAMFTMLGLVFGRRWIDWRAQLDTADRATRALTAGRH